MERRTFLSLMGIGTAAAGTAALGLPARAQDKQTFTLALVPGLTTDAFYITMRRGAEAAAAALGDELVFQGASEWNVTLQVPVLDAVIARQPDAILIAPTDKVQLVAPLKKAADAGIP
jgi:ribose transport system substrate-binding protein